MDIITILFLYFILIAKFVFSNNVAPEKLYDPNDPIKVAYRQETELLIDKINNYRKINNFKELVEVSLDEALFCFEENNEGERKIYSIYKKSTVDVGFDITKQKL